jgi:hypothetical protein
MPIIHHVDARWSSLMGLIIVVVVAVFWRKQYLARTSR